MVNENNEKPKRTYIRGKQGTNPFDKDFVHKPGGTKEILGSDGLHTRAIVHRSATDENHGSWFSSDTPEAFWNDIQLTLDRCDAIMLKFGWDRHAGNGRQFPGDRHAEPYSELWYAGDIGHICWALLTFNKPENPDTWVLRRVLNLGIEMSEMEWRLTYRSAILTGHKQRQTLTECRTKANDAKKLAVIARQDAISVMRDDTRLTKGGLETYLQRRLRDEVGITASKRTIRRDIKEFSE